MRYAVKKVLRIQQGQCTDEPAVVIKTSPAKTGPANISSWIEDRFMRPHPLPKGPLAVDSC